MQITFLLNGETVRLADVPPTQTLLDWLREERGLKGTKEGCNEGDCGACTVMVQDEKTARALNACILFMPQLNGKAVRTVEGLSGPDGELHPVQQAMIDLHGSQCGFCTPGFVVSMATAHCNGDTNFDDQLAGNLCRCTGYAPIIRAAEACIDSPVPSWLNDDIPARETGPAHPKSADELAEWYAANPDGTLIAGATDIGLWVTKDLQALDPVAFVGGCDDLKFFKVTDDEIRFGAALSVNDFANQIATHHPGFSGMLRRYGSMQVRNAATIGGNIANGSPIGDSPPALIALGAKLHLRHKNERRSILLEDFFIAYGKQDRRPGEFVESISIPRQTDRLKAYKISKRFDQDISALCGCFNIVVSDSVVTDAKIAFGGMAGIPKRSTHIENALIGQLWSKATIDKLKPLWGNDFSPLNDLRASADYRLATAHGLLLRYYLEDTGQQTNVLEVQA